MAQFQKRSAMRVPLSSEGICGYLYIIVADRPQIGSHGVGLNSTLLYPISTLIGQPILKDYEEQIEKLKAQRQKNRTTA